MAAFVQELLPRADWQFINTADGQQMGLVIACDGPFGLLIELVF